MLSPPSRVASVYLELFRQQAPQPQLHEHGGVVVADGVGQADGDEACARFATHLRPLQRPSPAHVAAAVLALVPENEGDGAEALREGVEAARSLAKNAALGLRVGQPAGHEVEEPEGPGLAHGVFELRALARVRGDGRRLHRTDRHRRQRRPQRLRRLAVRQLVAGA